jgi:DNA-binding transcriptional regulator LsrR (DeoR family)
MAFLGSKLTSPPQTTLERERVAVEVARRYYLENEAMAELAKAFDVSTSTISRLIALARDRGWVRIEVLDPDSHETESVRFLRQTFALDAIVSVPTRPATDMGDAVGRRAADILTQEITDNLTIGVAWGITTASIATHLQPTALVGCTAVQLNGAGSLRDLELDYAIHILGQFCSAWNATAVLLPVPAFFDNAATRDALWKERSIERVLEVQRSCDVAVFSVGSTSADRPSRVHTAGYISEADREQLAADGAVGDIATYFYDRDGNTERIRLNERASGLPLDILRDISTKYCVAAGIGKADALAAALRGGYVNRLIADSTLIDAVATLCRHDQAAGPVAPASAGDGEPAARG